VQREWGTPSAAKAAIEKRGGYRSTEALRHPKIEFYRPKSRFIAALKRCYSAVRVSVR
jgi:hypothetical protein